MCFKLALFKALLNKILFRYRTPCTLLITTRSHYSGFIPDRFDLNKPLYTEHNKQIIQFFFPLKSKVKLILTAVEDPRTFQYNYDLQILSGQRLG